ncbi:hypothetical protein NBO_344g0001 [Nosema bombycis CQ1]|uniref:Uncharacterized protein n=1 Tax=Nosema bombycis (strain CQ1 / CVCC 102059) TaxID=578461 RepID=R0MFJ3_NOSB1|nr:hypothetical protein NBO_344g0001 [Nosema bombycis CQ1]|eukprot:EOB12880.1 hypothetical protein NBO_344g0001 [Nosema bombycis CQ1]
MKLLAFGKGLRISKFSVCKQIIYKILNNNLYFSLKDVLYDFYGSPLFNAIPKKFLISILKEFFEGDDFCKSISERLLPSKLLSLKEIESILISKGFLGDCFLIYSYYKRKYDLNHKDSLEYNYLYYFDLNNKLNEEKVALRYLNRLREVLENKFVSYEESLDLIPEIERDFLLLSCINPHEIYKILRNENKEEGEI